MKFGTFQDLFAWKGFCDFGEFAGLTLILLAPG